MRRRYAILGLVLVAALFVFFAPVAYPTCFPLTCRVDGHACMGGCIPFTSSVIFWSVGYGGTSFHGDYQVTWP